MLDSRDVESTRAARLQLLFLVVVALTVAGSTALAFLYHVFWKQPLVDATVLMPRLRSMLSPKPDERFVFLTLAILVPIAAYWAVVHFPSLQNCSSSRIWRATRMLLPAILAGCFFGPLIGSDFIYYLAGKSTSPELRTRWLLASLAASLIWLGWVALGPKRPARANSFASSVAWTIFVPAMLLQIFAWRVVGERSISLSAPWWVSADAVIYTLSQVVAGKTLLVDLPSQYGLYAEMVAPVFRIIGLSILKFTVLCAVLQVASLSAVFYVVQKVVREPALKISIAVAVVMLTFETHIWLFGIDDRYFQYWPIRFLWPALAVLAFYLYSKRRTVGRGIVVSIIGAIGSLWNADSGLAIEIAFAAFLVSKSIFFYERRRYSSPQERSHLARLLALHLAIFVLVVGAMFAYLMAKSGHGLHLSWLFKYQRLFYGLGFMMMPTPLQPHPWMLFVATYLMGIMTAFALWLRRPGAKRADLILFLSFLGLGLFLYYQGRSHVLNLFNAGWPALILAVILADGVVRSVRARRLQRVYLIVPAAVLAVILFSCISFVAGTGKLWDDAVSAFVTRNTPADLLVSDELNFIRAHSARGEPCVILARRQGLYYAATGLVSPVKGPGYVELMTVRDRDTFLWQLSNNRFECVFVGVGPESGMEIDTDPLAALPRYSVEATSSMGSMRYLRPLP